MIDLISSIYIQSRRGYQVQGCEPPKGDQGQLYLVPKNKYFVAINFCPLHFSKFQPSLNFYFQAAIDLKWSHPNKVLIHVADAPAHGPLFHEPCK